MFLAGSFSTEKRDSIWNFFQVEGGGITCSRSLLGIPRWYDDVLFVSLISLSLFCGLCCFLVLEHCWLSYIRLNPIWTLETGSLFLIRTTVMDFFARSQFLTFVIEDYDGLTSNDFLGSVEVAKQYILKDGGTGERVDFDINTVDPMHSHSRGMFLSGTHHYQEGKVNDPAQSPQGVRDSHKQLAGKVRQTNGSTKQGYYPDWISLWH
jgi:hypothetical protein